MKHIINLIVSNPSHEFVSLRSKMHNKNFVVEAYDELEAINRATQKFRSLGFKVHSALVEQKVEIQKPVKVMAAIDDVAEFAGSDELDEIGSSDVSGWVKQVVDGLESGHFNNVDEGLGTSPDKLLARTGMNNAHKFPRDGQTNLGNIPAMNTPGNSPETYAYADRQRAARLGNLKAAIKDQLGKHRKPNLPKQGVAEAVDYKDLEKPTIKRIKSGETKPVDRTNYKDPPAMRKKTSLESYLDDKKETQSIEEAAPQYIEEKLTGADPASKWIHDFVHSDNPMFDGKSKQERIRMALGAKYEKTNEMHNPMHNSLGRPDLDLRDHDTHDVVFSHTKGGMRILHLVKYKSKEDAEKFLSSVIEKGGKGIIRPPKNTNNDKPEKKHSFVRAIVGGKQIRTDEGNDDNKKLKLTKNKPPQVNVTPTLNSIEKDKV